MDRDMDILTAMDMGIVTVMGKAESCGFWCFAFVLEKPSASQFTALVLLIGNYLTPVIWPAGLAFANAETAWPRSTMNLPSTKPWIPGS